MTVVRVTTAPTRPPGGGLLRRLTNAWHATMEDECQSAPGVQVLDAKEGFDRRKAEAMHNWALEHGFESELTYHRRPTGWELRVRRPGDTEPMFLQEQAELQGD
jgi:hypothetical protein